PPPPPSRAPRGTPSGFDPALLRLVERSGLDPILRPWNGGARSAAKSWGRETVAQAGGLVIPAGDEIPGYPDAASAFGLSVATHGGRFGFVEFTEQLGARPAAAAARGAVVVVHSLGEKEMSSWEEEGRRRPIRRALLARWARAARERAVRVFYIHPFLRPPLGSTGRLTEVNVQYISDLAAAVRKDGFTVGRAAPWPPFGGDVPGAVVRRGGLLAAHEGLAYTLCGLGGCARLSGASRESLLNYQKAWRIFSRLRDAHGLAYAACGTGSALRYAGRPRDAARWYRQAVSRYRRLGDRANVGLAVWEWGMLERQGETRRGGLLAARRFHEAAREFAAAGDRRGAVLAALALGQFRAAQSSARRLGLRADALHAGLGLRRGAISAQIRRRYRRLAIRPPQWTSAGLVLA
ncbi:MAG: DUF5693 family protein, partial [bacterium]